MVLVSTVPELDLLRALIVALGSILLSQVLLCVKLAMQESLCLASVLLHAPLAKKASTMMSLEGRGALRASPINLGRYSEGLRSACPSASEGDTSQVLLSFLALIALQAILVMTRA